MVKLMTATRRTAKTTSPTRRNFQKRFICESRPFSRDAPTRLEDGSGQKRKGFYGTAAPSSRGAIELIELGRWQDLPN